MALNVEAGLETAVLVFPDRLADAVDQKRSQLLVGLDPRPELLPVELRGEAHVNRAAAAEACGRFCLGLVDAVAPYVVGVKVQLAFFEALGADGAHAFEDVCSYARTAGLLVVADGKRGDIGSTARAYADAHLERVVGATYPRAVAEARKLMPQAVLLLPGIGAQGATPADVARAFKSGPASALVSVSRSIIYAFRV